MERSSENRCVPTSGKALTPSSPTTSDRETAPEITPGSHARGDDADDDGGGHPHLAIISSSEQSMPPPAAAADTVDDADGCPEGSPLMAMAV